MTQDTLTRDIEVGRDGAVMSAAFARPQKKNAITGAMYEALIEAFDTANRDPDVGALVVSGKGGVFTAGNDISDFLTVALRETGEFPAWRFVSTVARVRKAADRGDRWPSDRRRDDALFSLRSRLRHARGALPDAIRQSWPSA